MDTELTLAEIVGALFVLSYSWYKFRIPRSNRASTTAARYYAAAVSYCAWGLLLYAALLLTRDPVDRLVPSVLKAMEEDGLSYPLLVALLLTNLLPKVPILSFFDTRIREQLESMAAIPYEVRRLAAELEKSDWNSPEVSYVIPEDIRARATRELVRLDFHPDDLAFEAGVDLKALWTKASVLMLRIQEWRTERKLSSFGDASSGTPEELRRTYEQLAPKVRTCFRSLRSLGDNTSPPDGRDIVAEYRSEVERQVRALLAQMYYLISAATLHCAILQQERVQRLMGLGFRFHTSLRPSPLLLVHRLVGLFASLLVILLAVLTMVGVFGLAPRLTPTRSFALAVMVSWTYVVAVFWAVFPKERGFIITKAADSESRPYLWYIMSAVLAAASNFPIGLLWTWLTPSSGPGDIWRSLPWLVLSFATAFMTALLIDDTRGSWLFRGGALGEGFAQGLVTGASAFLVIRLLEGLGVTPTTGPWVVLVLSSAIGFAIGRTVPSWYRTAPRHRATIGMAPGEAAWSEKEKAMSPQRVVGSG